MVPPVREIVCVPAVAVSTSLPPEVQVVLAFGEGATTTPFAVVPGSVSNSDTFTSGDVFVFRSVIVSVDKPLGLTVVGKKALLTVRSLNACTVRFAERSLAVVRFWSFVILAGGMMLE